MGQRATESKKNLFISFGSIKYYKISLNSLVVLD